MSGPRASGLKRTSRTPNIWKPSTGSTWLWTHFPVNGGLVTLDGLMQGVPAITLSGQAPQGRIGASILHHLGLDRFVSRSEAGYVALAVELAENPDGLGAMRRSVQQSAQAAFGTERCRHHAAEIEQAYRAIWDRQVARSAL